MRGQSAHCVLDLGAPWAALESAIDTWERCLGVGCGAWLLKVPPPLEGKPCPPARPCRYFSCQWHMAVDWSRSNTPQLVRPDIPLSEQPYSCLWDVVHDHPHGMTVDEIADRVNLSERQVCNTIKAASENFVKAAPDLARKLLNRYHSEEP